ncbi:sodium- and chloride-dependent glycine transporter 2 [Trichonephila clavipes]|nr:sodium- and chloride-dependent glycine transporter 2 [Trichonephila clavipes]
MSYFTSIFPFFGLVILLIIACLEEGAWQGIKYFFQPNLERLKDITVWYKATEQSFFSLNIAYGSIIMVASYNKFHNNIYRDAIIISVLDTVVNLLAGCVSFAVLGSLSYKYSKNIHEVVDHEGLGLAFIVYPEALAAISYVPQLWAVLFFFMLFVLGVGSSMSQMETLLTVLKDRFPRLRQRIWLLSLTACLLFFALGLPLTTNYGQQILVLLNNYGVGIAVFFYAVLEVIGVAWIYGLRNFCKDVEFMLNKSPGIFWKFTWSLTAPVALMADGSTNLEQPTLNHVQSNTMASAALSDPTRALQGTNLGSGPVMEESKNDVGSFEQLLLYAEEYYLAGKLPLGDHLGKVLHGVEEYHQRIVGPLRTVWGELYRSPGRLHTRTRLSSAPKTNRDSSLNTTFCQSVTFHIDLAWHHCRLSCRCSGVKGSARKGCLDLRLASARCLEIVCGTIATPTSARIVERVTVGSTSACRTILRSSLLVVFLVAQDPVFRAWVPSRIHCSQQFLTAHSERSTWSATQRVDQPAVFIPMIRPLSNSLNCKKCLLARLPGMLRLPKSSYNRRVFVTFMNLGICAGLYSTLFLIVAPPRRV